MKRTFQLLTVLSATLSISFMISEKLYSGSNTNSSHVHFNSTSLKTKAVLYSDTIIQYIVATQDFSLCLDKKGEIAGYINREKNNPRVMKMAGNSTLVGFKSIGKVTVRNLSNGGYEFSRLMVNHRKDSCKVSERYIPTQNSIHLEVRVSSNSIKPWTAPLTTGIKLSTPKQLKFWTSWVDDGGRVQNQKNKKKSSHNSSKTEAPKNDWHDPLTSRPFVTNVWNYGNWDYGASEGGGFCLPLATVLDKNNDMGLSLVVSPIQPLLWLQLKTKTDGTILFQHNSLKFGNSNSVILSVDFVKHEAEWRGGLRWMVENYPEYFNPIIPMVGEMAGMGAYSHYQGDLDTAFLKKINFRIIWDANFEWPYFGIFFPPVQNSTTWKSCGSDEKGDITPSLMRDISYQSMDQYNFRMKRMGFFVLNYFNLTEFGSKISKTASPKNYDEGNMWKDANTYLYKKMPDGIFRNHENEGVVYTWGNAVVIDPGDPETRNNLITQTHYFLKNLPNSAGVCIDRMDHLLRINFANGADDKIGWYNHRSGRFLGFSWIDIMSKIGPMIHEKDKVIFVNPVKYGHRVEWFKEVDGIYDEFGYKGYALNGSSLIGLRKPVLMWTTDTSSLKPNPDIYFQRHLYMGAYPTAPFEGNDHAIRPKTWADQYYIDYGPLFGLLRGKKWVLTPYCVETSTAGVKVNLFQVQGGYLLPVTLGDTLSSATVFVRNIKNLKEIKCEVWFPGSAQPIPVLTDFKDNVLKLKVPLKRGCALVKLSDSKS